MNFTGSKYYEAPPLFVPQGEAILKGSNGFCDSGTKNPFLDTFPDPLCELNLKETSDFVKSFPMGYNNNVSESVGILDASTHRRRDSGSNSVSKRSVEAPQTPGRPVFSFSTAGNVSRKSFPSKWDDAEKWLASGTTCRDSPANNHHSFSKPSESFKMSKQFNGFKHHGQAEIFAEKSRVTEENVSKVAKRFQAPFHLDHHHFSVEAFSGVSSSTDVLLKDKFTNEAESFYKEGFVFGNAADKSKKEAATEAGYEVQHRDVGTEMTPIGSSTTSRCHTPFKNASPARHNTPNNRSGPLVLANLNSTNAIDIKQFQECHLAKLNLGSHFDSVTSNWSSREEEEEDISKSLRHCEISDDIRKSVSESRACAWEDEEKNKCCLRYQREEAKIQAWVNLQNAKAEAQSRKLEVKIQKMKANFEEKLMKRMAVVHRKAEEWRATAQLQHFGQIQRVTEQAQKMLDRQNSHFTGHNSCSCTCFPCNKQCD